MKAKALEGSLPKELLVRLAFWRATTRDPTLTPNLIDRLLEKLVYTKLRSAMGERMRMMISGGAALSDWLYRFYLNIGIPLYQGYGLTEASPVICANRPGANRIGTCGQPFPGVEVKCSGEGELLARGDNIMHGYHNNPEATAEAIDDEGWLHTGDLATVDAEGYITITGRKKELFKTSTGEYVSSVHIEQKLLEKGWFEHAMLIGHDKPFVTALLFIDHEFLGKLAAKHKTTPLKILDRGILHRMTQKWINRLNKTLNHWERIRDFRIIDNSPTIASGELTPSMKLAKKAVVSRYDDLIHEMYKDHL
jgi:long-chain acyl-CoA synthetase